jgi:hypothetical protein
MCLCSRGTCMDFYVCMDLHIFAYPLNMFVSVIDCHMNELASGSLDG